MTNWIVVDKNDSLFFFILKTYGMSKKIIFIILALLALSIGCYFIFFNKTKPVAIIKTEKVKLGSMSTSVTATGTLEPVNEVEVGTQVSGTIDKIYVEHNDVVKKGQLLAELDRSNLKSTLDAVKTEYASKLNEYNYYAKIFKRNKELHTKSLISDSEFEEIEYKYIQAKNSLEKSKFEVDKAQTNLNYATIYSPINGVVLSVEVDEGQTVAASMTTPTLFVIAEDLTAMQVVADIDEADIGVVKEGQRVEFTVDAYPSDKFQGVVKQVRLEPTITSNVVTYEVIVEAPNKELKLKPGLTANITVFTFEKDSVLVLPSKSLRFQMDMSLLPPNMRVEPLKNRVKVGSSVWVVSSDSVAKQKEVKLGISNGSSVEVISGLREGDEVIVSSMEISEDMEPRSKNSEQGENNPFMPNRPKRGMR